MERIFWVGAGGFLGAVGRYLVAGGIGRIVSPAVFPLGTLVVNVVGCGLIGLLGVASATRFSFSPEARALLFVGLLGGFTTFSAFAFETLALGREGASARAVANVALNVTLCLAAAWGGAVLGRTLWGAP